MQRWRFVLLMTALSHLACASTASPRPPSEKSAERGGELADSIYPSASVEVHEDRVVAWGVTEVPAGSRLQAAYAIADANARSELIKLVVNTVASLDIERSQGNASGSHIQIERLGTEAVAAALPRTAAPKHGWEQVERGGEKVLRVVARLSIRREVLEQALVTQLADAARFAAEFRDALERRAKTTTFVGAGMPADGRAESDSETEAQTPPDETPGAARPQ